MTMEWIQIPGYPYKVKSDGSAVCNRLGHILKPIQLSAGIGYEFRQCGQRDKILLSDILELAGIGGNHENH